MKMLMRLIYVVSIILVVIFIPYLIGKATIILNILTAKCEMNTVAYWITGILVLLFIVVVYYGFIKGTIGYIIKGKWNFGDDWPI